MSTALAPEVETLEPWAATLVEQVIADRKLDAAAYAPEYRDDGTRITVLLTRRDRPAGLRGSEPGKPNYEIVLDRAGRRVERVSVAR